MIQNQHYLYRMTVLYTISLLAPVVGAELFCQTMLPVVINAAKDRYMHVFLCCQTLLLRTNSLRNTRVSIGVVDLLLTDDYRVPNIRFNVAKILQSLMAIVDRLVHPGTSHSLLVLVYVVSVGLV